MLTVEIFRDMPPHVVFAPAPEIRKITPSSSVDDVLAADVVQDMPEGDAVFVFEPEKKELTQTSTCDEILTSDIFRDVPPDVVFAPAPEIKKIAQSSSVDYVFTADVVQDMPEGDGVFAPEPEEKKMTQTSTSDEILTSDIFQDMPPDIVFAPAPEINKITQTSSVDDVLTTDVVQDMPQDDIVFTPELEIKTIAEMTPSDFIRDPRAHHSHDISFPEIETNDLTRSAQFQPQVYTPLETVVSKDELKDIEDKRCSPSLIDTFDTSLKDPLTDTSDHNMNSGNPKSSKKLRHKIFKSYVDYLSDHEDFSADSSDLWSMNESESSTNSENKKKKLTKKKHKSIDKKEKTANTIETLVKVKTKK